MYNTIYMSTLAHYEKMPIENKTSIFIIRDKSILPFKGLFAKEEKNELEKNWKQTSKRAITWFIELSCREHGD